MYPAGEDGGGSAHVPGIHGCRIQELSQGWCKKGLRGSVIGTSSQGMAKLGYTDHACVNMMRDAIIRQSLIRQSETRSVPGNKDQ